MKRMRVAIALVSVSIAGLFLLLPAAAAARMDTSAVSMTGPGGGHPYIGTRPASNPKGFGAAALPQHSTSTNWSGYTVQTSFPTGVANSVSDVKATWVVPTVTGGTSDAYSSNWIGIDGYSSPTVEQVGTEQDWVSGSPLYYAWWEMYPGAEVLIPTMTINPGDVINAEVRWVSGNQFSLTITDATTAGSFTTVRTLAAVRSSAEWIVEAPSSSGGVLPFASIGPSPFTSCSVTLNGTTGPISGAGWQYDPIVLISGSGGATLASPSALTAGGTAFVVTAPGSDTIPPTTTSDVVASYDNVAVIDLTATDNVGGSGVAATHYQVDGGATQTGDVVTVSTYGSHTLTFWSVDAAGNVENPQTVAFAVNDTIPPTTTSDVVPAYLGAALIRLTAIDNPGGSGVAVTHYTLDGVVMVPYSGSPISVTATGTHTLTYWSVDNAGNIEATHSADFTISPRQATSISLRASATSITRGASVGLWSTVSGGVPAGTIVRYEVRKPGSTTYVLLASKAAYSSGSSSYRYKPTQRGYFYFRVRFLGNVGYAASVSPSRRVRVR